MQPEKIKNTIKAFINHSTDANYSIDRDGQIIFWSKGAEQLYGYTASEALSMKIWDLIPEHDRLLSESLLKKINTGEIIQSVESTRITKDKKILNVLFSGSEIIEGSGSDKSIAITERDVTQQKRKDELIKSLSDQVQENLSKAEAAKKELVAFSYSVSHDLRAPLRAILGNIAVIEEDHFKETNDEIQGLLRRIGTNAKKIQQQIDDLLLLSRLNRQEMRPTENDMKELTELCAKELFESTHHRANITIHKLASVLADPVLIKQVMNHLLSNAIKFSSKNENPEIEIGIQQIDHQTVFYVKDNGVGFDMKYAEKLFSAFQRLHREDEFKGTGIGLAIVASIINKHGGKVWPEARLGEGATFFFTLPTIN